MAIGSHTRAAVAGYPYRSFASLVELATWADCLVAATPGGAGTRYLINAEVLAALGPHGSLVNVGRGTVVDTQALLEALRAQRLVGAGLDGLEGEPGVPPLLPALLHCDNVVVTPHVAGRAPESRSAATAMLLANLHAHCAGQPLPSPVARTA
jgi:lactate dehydrogenase-like 2-hydroxyacid dehydrogenase